VSKFLNKYLRKTHRWLALPFIALIIIVLVTQGTSVGDAARRVQSIMMVLLAISGGYLYLLPYLTKWQRKRKRTNSNRVSINQH
jgi:hypothetical protein